ncbi:MAG: amino acid adenylation domain-containing protein, partial [Dehalococcoidia bacterium]
MSNTSGPVTGFPSRQQGSLQGDRVRPTNPFVPFKKEEIEQSIPARFEQQVRSYPDRLAVKTRKHELTYEALDKAANRVARAILAQRGTGEEPIALLFEHGAPAIVAILGVLKAGKFYVPLDSSYPRARITSMLEDAQAGLIVTNNQHLALASELAQHGCHVLDIDAIDDRLFTENLGLALSPDTLAAIFYTSGSTGQPKGVVQNHRNVLHFIMNYTNSAHICADDRLSLLHSCGFAASVRSIFGALLNGAPLFPFNLKEEGLAHLATWLIQEEITIYYSVPSTFRHFVGTLTGEEECPKLRLIKLAGEPVFKRDVELYKKHFSADCIFVNTLGASEALGFRQYFIDKATPITGSLVPVGYAVEGMEVLLLDEAGKEVGENCTGEIAVKSRYLSPGYWRQPELTRAAFLPDPAGGRECIYRTGDLGCMRPDGCLVYLGRKDLRVKIRGHRIDIAEIEQALLDHAAIKEVVAVAREDRPGDQRLVAYVVPARHPGPTVSELRRFLNERLPDYMIPLAFVMLDALPLTSTGKVDRQALPALGRSRPELASPFVAARTSVEEVLVGIWTDVLGLEQLSIHDNFFELGGHSLLATQVISRLREVFHAELPLRSL